MESPDDLRKDDSIIITKLDKRNGIVIINKLDYLNRMKQLFPDKAKFKKLTHNPTKSRQDNLTSLYFHNLKKGKSHRRCHPTEDNAVPLMVSFTAFLRFIACEQALCLGKK